MKRVIFNQKGGVGKTSIACNLAAISAAMGYRTLVVDLDVQGNTTHYLVGAVDGEAFPAEAQGVAGLYRQTVGPRKMGRNPDSFVWETPFLGILDILVWKLEISVSKLVGKLRS